MSSITSQISLVITIAPVLPTEELDNSLSMGDEHLSTISETEPEKVIKSSVKNLVPIPIESEVTSDNESEYDVPVYDESSLIFTTFSNPLFDCNDGFTSSDDESLANEDIPMENFKIYSNPLIDDEEIISSKIDPPHFVESNLIKSLLNQDTLMILFLISFSPSPILVEDSDSQIEEIDLFLDTDDLMPSGIENDYYDSKGDIYCLVELLSNDTLPLPENDSFNFDHHDDLSFLRPPPEPPDVEIFFDFEPDTVFLTAKVVEFYVLMIKVLCTLCPIIDPLLQFSSKNEDKVFKPSILSYLLISHRDKTIFDFSENPRMTYGGDIPHLDVLFLLLDKLKYGESSQAQDSDNKNKRFVGGNPCLSLIVVN
nr:hypothetical protein [Tanacetum cinerariifolium]